MIRPLSTVLTLLALLFGPATAFASGAWTTYMHHFTCNDLIAQRDTVWVGSGEAGLIRYLRSAGSFESFTREPGGVASNSITALAFDRGGRLWVGTLGKGASRLSSDGSTWDLVNAFDGLPSDSVTVLRAAGDSMFIGTLGGIALWDGTQVAGSVPDLGTPSPFRSNRVRGIVLLRDSLFVGTTDGVYLALISDHLNSWTALDGGLPNKNVVSMATDGRDVFVLASGVTYRWSVGAQQWGSVANQGNAKLLRDDFGVVSSSTAAGVWTWNGSTWVLVTGSPVTSAPSPGEVEFGVDPDGKMFATRDGLLWEQGSPWVSHEPPGPLENDLQNVIVDQGRVWINTFASGVSRLDGTTWRHWKGSCCGTLQDTSFANPSFAFTLMRDRLGRKWISAWGTAIERVDDTTEPPHVDHLILPGGVDSLINHTCMWSSASDDSNYVYLGGDTFSRGSRPPVGIDVYNPDGTLRIVWKTTNSGIPDNQVRALLVDDRSTPGRIWAGFAIGGAAYAAIPSDKNAVPQFTLLPRTSTLEMFGLAQYGDSMWVLTTSSLKRFNASTFAEISTLDLLAGPPPRGAVHPLEVSRDGTVWVGSVDGVRRYKPGGGYEDYKESNSPLANNEVRAITSDPATGTIWFATAGGLSRFDPGYVPPPPPSIPSLHMLVFPNPAQFPAVGLDLRLSGNASAYTGEIYDLSGRLVHRFFSGGNGRVVWDGRDLDGARVGPGIYFVRAHAGGHEATARVVVLR